MHIDFSYVLAGICTMIALLVLLWLIIHLGPAILEFTVDLTFGLLKIVVGAAFIIATSLIILGLIIFNTIREGWSKLL